MKQEPNTSLAPCQDWLRFGQRRFNNLCPRPRLRRRIRRGRRRVRRRRRRRVRRHFRRVRRGAYWIFAPPGAGIPWRLHRRHIIVIEREAGKPIDELSEEELEELLEKLGIEKEDLEDEDEEALGEEDKEDEEDE